MIAEERILRAIESLRTEFGELRGDFGELRGDFGELKGDFVELKGDFGELKGDFGELKGDFGELKGGFQGLRRDIDALHLTVVRIENEHGLKIDLALEGLHALSQKVDSNHLELKSDIEAIHMDAGRICRSVNQLQTIVGDHEHRIRVLEH